MVDHLRGRFDGNTSITHSYIYGARLVPWSGAYRRELKALHSGIAEKGDDRAVYAGWMGADEIHQEKALTGGE